MKRNTLNYRRDGMPRSGNEEMYAFAEERYRNLLREAEQYRLERRTSRPRPSASLQAGSQPLARLLRWAKTRWADLCGLIDRIHHIQRGQSNCCGEPLPLRASPVLPLSACIGREARGVSSFPCRSEIPKAKGKRGPRG